MVVCDLPASGPQVPPSHGHEEDGCFQESETDDTTAAAERADPEMAGDTSRWKA